jgi:hypothetical protein
VRTVFIYNTKHEITTRTTITTAVGTSAAAITTTTSSTTIATATTTITRTNTATLKQQLLLLLLLLLILLQLVDQLQIKHELRTHKQRQNKETYYHLDSNRNLIIAIAPTIMRCETCIRRNLNKAEICSM